jgi:hypothetical protein
VIEAKLRKIAPRPMVSMTTANCGWPSTRRSTVASRAEPNSPTIAMASANATQ